MISLILLVIAFLLFILAGVNQDLFSQSPADLVAFGLAAWVLSVILSGVGPASPVRRVE
jgi:hypothetical protein